MLLSPLDDKFSLFSLVKTTEQYWSFRIFALPDVSDIRTPFDLSGAVLQESLLDITYFQNLLVALVWPLSIGSSGVMKKAGSN